MSLRTIAAARQKEMNDSITVVAITTLGVIIAFVFGVCKRASFSLLRGRLSQIYLRDSLRAGARLGSRFIREDVHEELGFIRLAWKRDLRSSGQRHYGTFE